MNPSLIPCAFAAFILSACGPGGASCAKFHLVTGADQKPVQGAQILVYRLDDPSTIVTAAYEGQPGSYLTGPFQCRGTTIMQIDHPQYQSIRMEYRSPNDRSISGNHTTDESTIIMYPR